jgi:uncharacterized membrane protein YvlD (DUF360 family)
VLRSFVTSFLALTASLWLLPGTQATDGVYSVAYLAIVVILVGALVRPLITRLTVITGVVGLLVFGLLAQAVVLGIALELVPTVEPFSFTEIVVASWAAAVSAATFNWLVDTSSDQVFFGQVMGRAVRATPRAGAVGPGLLVVQLDGVSEPVLRQAITAGSMPTISRWVRSGSHELRGWHTGVPATTPAGQAMLLHGDDRSVPGYRWYDKEQGRLLAAGRPADAAVMEKSISDGHGLLAYGGASVSNLFSGDAPIRLMTVSHAKLPGADPGSASFAALRFGFLRSAALFVGVTVLEWYQGRRQRLRGVVPRVPRGGSFLVLRGLTTVILRDLNVSIVADQMAAGAPVIYVDFVDYDEVAHHAGPTRPESLRTLENLDRVLDAFDQLAVEVGRRYEIAVVSDHGQAQGATFLQLSGQTLGDVVRDLASAECGAEAATPHQVSVDEHGDESWMPATVLLSGATATGRALARFWQWLARRSSRNSAAQQPGPGDADLLVAVSGGLAHVYRTDLPGRLTREHVDELHPRLVRGLAEHPQVGLVLTRREDGALMVDGVGGWRAWAGEPGRAEPRGGAGSDPLAPYDAGAVADLLALHHRAHVGDLVVLGRYDPRLGEVVAFEELVGSHGGLGGWQTEAFLLHPAGWPRPRPGVLSGLDVHRALVDRLVRLGLREAP